MILDLRDSFGCAGGCAEGLLYMDAVWTLQVMEAKI